MGRVWTAIVAAFALIVGPLGQGAAVMAAGPAPKKRVLIVPVQRAPDVAAIVGTKTQGYLETLLGMEGNVEIVPPDALVAAAEAPAAPAKGAKDVVAGADAEGAGAIAAADKLAGEAAKLAAKRRWEPAIKTWKAALGLYEKGLGYLEDHDKLVQAYLGLSFAYFGWGYTDNGEEELGRAFALNPELALDKKAPRDALDIQERVKVRVTTDTGLQLKVTSNAPRATVIVDGKNRGSAPLTLGELTRGIHAVRVVADGYEPHGALVTLVTTSADVDAQLVRRAGSGGGASDAPAVAAVQPKTGLEGYAASGDFGGDFQAAAKNLAKANRLDAIVMTYVRKNGDRFEIGTIVWEAEKARVGAVDSALVASDLGGLQVTVLDLVERTGALIAQMPPERVLVGRAPIYEPIGGGVASVTPPAPSAPSEPPPEEDTLVIEEPVGPGATDDVSVAAAEEPARPAAVETNEPVEAKHETARPREPSFAGDHHMTKGPMTAHVDTPADDEPLVLEPLVLEPVEAHVSTPQDLSDPHIRKKDDTEFYETWWFWTIVGGVAAGSAAAIVLTQDGGAGGGGPGGFRATVSW